MSKLGVSVRGVLRGLLMLSVGVLAGSQLGQAPANGYASPEVYRLPTEARGDVVTAVRTIASRHDHGQLDDLPPETMGVIALRRKLQATCGFVAGWAVEVLDEAGFTARRVHTLTLDEWNDVNNGHSLIEAVVPGHGWVAFDVDKDAWFWRAGRPLSLLEWVDAVRAGEPYEIRRLNQDPLPEPEAGMRATYQRVAQVPFVEDGARWFTVERRDAPRVESYAPGTYRWVPTRSEFVDRFYAD